MRPVDEMSLAGARSWMLKAGLGSCHACQRNIQPAKPWKRTTLYETGFQEL